MPYLVMTAIAWYSGSGIVPVIRTMSQATKPMTMPPNASRPDRSQTGIARMMPEQDGKPVQPAGATDTCTG